MKGPGWTGKVEATIKLKELQFQERAGHSMELKPRKEAGRWDVELRTDVLPGQTLSGAAVIGPVASTEAARGTMQADFSFANGAEHRVRWRRGGAGLLVQVWSAIPGAPVRSFETELKRSTRAAP